MNRSEDLRLDNFERSALDGETERAAHDLLRKCFRDAAADYFGRDIPDRILLLSGGGRLIGHLAAYVRTVALVDEELSIGLIGDVAIDEPFRSRGHAKRLVQAAHGFFRERSLPFSVLFAFDPPVYRSSGYRPMTNQTRFLEGDEWKQLVHRGGMVAELASRKWPATDLDLRGRAV